MATSGILPENTYPQFTSWPAAKYVRAGGPFDPHTGDYYVYSQIADVSYKRLTKTFTVPAGGSLDFWVSHDTEPALGLLPRGGPHGGAGRLDHAARPETGTSQDTGRRVPGGTSHGRGSAVRQLPNPVRRVGFDGIANAGTRAAIMDRVVDFLLG